MRYLAAQFDAFFHDDLWLDNAKNANETALYLAERCASILGGESIVGGVEANEVFVRFPNMDSVYSLQESWDFHVWDEQTNLVRFVCSFDTLKDDIEALMKDLKKLV